MRGPNPTHERPHKRVGAKITPSKITAKTNLAGEFLWQGRHRRIALTTAVSNTCACVEVPPHGDVYFTIEKILPSQKWPPKWGGWEDHVGGFGLLSERKKLLGKVSFLSFRKPQPPTLPTWIWLHHWEGRISLLVTAQPGQLHLYQN